MLVFRTATGLIMSKLAWWIPVEPTAATRVVAIAATRVETMKLKRKVRKMGFVLLPNVVVILPSGKSTDAAVMALVLYDVSRTKELVFC
jgi:hypothetical protein